MAFLHHGTIRKYTAALLDVFNDLEIQYDKSNGETASKQIPLTYSVREKSRIFDSYTTEQLLSGNYSVLPRASLALASMTKAESRITNKNNKISKYKTDDVLEYSFNSVPFEFTYDIVVQCRGMNEVTQIVEQLAPKFNPTVNIDIWDAGNLNEPTRVPLKLTDISFETEEYEELSSNIFTVTFSISLMGNLYPPIKEQGRIKEFMIMINQIDGDYYDQKALLDWDVDLDGNIIGGGPGVFPESTPGLTATIPGEKGTISLPASKISVADLGDYYTGTTLEEILAEIAEKNFQELSEKGQPNGYASLNANGKVPWSQLPQYGTTVAEYPTMADFPAVGDTDVIYVAQDTGNVYQYEAPDYIQISSYVELAQEATKLSTPREITITIDGATSGSAIFDGSSDIQINLSGYLQVLTTDRLPIVNNAVTLPYKSLEVIDNAYIYRDGRNVASVFECDMAPDGWSIFFDPADGLDGLECTVRYFAAI